MASAKSRLLGVISMTAWRTRPAIGWFRVCLLPESDDRASGSA
jgi:hypothetical protein